MDERDALALRFEALGPLRVWREGNEVRLGPVQQRTVLAVLVLHTGRPLGRERLIDAVWGADAPAFAVNLLQKHVSGLRRALDPRRPPGAPSRLLIWGDGGYRLAVPDGDLDVRMFERAVRQARAVRADGDLASAADTLRTALATWRGPLCDGLTSPFLDVERERLNEWRVDVLEDRIELDLRLDGGAEPVSELRTLIAGHPGRERLRALLMLALYRSGRQADALAVFHEARRHLVEELGIEPGPGLRRIHEQILAADPVLIPTTEPAGREGGVLPREVPTRARPASVTAPEAAPPAPARAAPGPVPAQLPYGLPDFTGRKAELEQLDALYKSAAGGAVVISAIGGMAGVGKTALAVHWAHRARKRFPDGQLYVNLRGFAPAGPAMAPAEAVRGFLDAFAVPPQRVPISFEGQAALYRSLIADRRMLIVLDNAESSEQVRPLLPGAPGCLVLVTSRDHLSGLVAAEGAQPLPVDLLPVAEAERLLTRRLGEARVRREPAAILEIIELCARLPLALAIVAARAATHPGIPLASLAEELREARGGLDAFHTEDRSTDIRSVFSWSLERLPADSQRAFRLLGLHPGPEFSLHAAASLAGMHPPEARISLADLARANLVSEHAAGRFAMHDLLRAYSAELADGLESGEDRRAALQRGCDHYLQTAFAADRLINPLRDPPPIAPPRHSVTLSRITDPDRAMKWYVAEHSVLLAVIDQAAAHGLNAHSWQLAWAVSTYLDRRAAWQDLASTQLTALSAAERLGDRTGQALARQGIARAQTRLGRFEEAHRHLAAALALYEETGDRPGQGLAHMNFTAVLELQGRDLDALGHARQALDLYRAEGHKAGLADALNAVGWFNSRVGDYKQGLLCCEESLALYEELRDQGGLAQTWDSLGFAHYHLGDAQKAVTCFEHALTLFRELGDRYNEAATLMRLGDTRSAAGADAAAQEAWEHALDVFTEIGHTEARQASARLGDTR